MSTVKKLFRGSVAQTAQMIVNIVAGLFMLPFMISQLGEDLYGIWILIGGFTASLYLFDFGFASAVTRFMARYISKKDNESVNCLVSSALVIYTGLAFLIMMATFVIMWFSPVWIDNAESIGLIRSLIFLAGLTLAIEFPFKAFSGVSSAYIRYDIIAYFKVIIKIVSVGVTVWALLSGYKLLAVALIALGSSVLSNLIFFGIAKYLHRPLRIGYRYINKNMMLSLWSYSGWAFLIDITRIAKDKLPIFMIAAFLSTSALTVYYVALRLVEYSVTFLGKATNMSTPIFAACHARDDMEDMRAKIIVFQRINTILGFYLVYCLVLLGSPLINLWMGADFNFNEASLVLAILIVSKITAFAFSPLSSALMAISRHHWQALLGLCEVGVSALFIFIALVAFDSGLIGVALGAASPLLIGRAIILPVIANHELNLSVSRIYSNLLRPLVLISLCFILSAFLLNYFNVATMFQLLVAGIAISFIYWPVVLFSLTEKEWGYVLDMLPDRIGIPLKGLFALSSRRDS